MYSFVEDPLSFRGHSLIIFRGLLISGKVSTGNLRPPPHRSGCEIDDPPYRKGSEIYDPRIGRGLGTMTPLPSPNSHLLVAPGGLGLMVAPWW